MKVRTEGLKNKSSSNITKNSTNKSIRNTKGADFNDDNSTRVAGPYARDPAVDSWGSGDKTSNTHSGDRRDHLLGARAAYQLGDRYSKLQRNYLAWRIYGQGRHLKATFRACVWKLIFLMRVSGFSRKVLHRYSMGDGELVEAVRLAPALRSAADLRVVEELLLRVPYFQNLTAQQRSKLCPLVTYAAYVAGDCIFSAGQEVDQVLVIQSGTVAVEKRVRLFGAEGDVLSTQCVQQLGRGETLGEDALAFAPAGARHLATAKTRTATELLCVPVAAFLQVCWPSRQQHARLMRVHIQKVPLFRGITSLPGCGEARLANLARMCVYRIAAPGTVLMQQGDKHNHNFFVTVLRGHVSVVRSLTPPGKTRPISLHVDDLVALSCFASYDWTCDAHEEAGGCVASLVTRSDTSYLVLNKWDLLETLHDLEAATANRPSDLLLGQLERYTHDEAILAEFQEGRQWEKFKTDTMQAALSAHAKRPNMQRKLLESMPARQAAVQEAFGGLKGSSAVVQLERRQTNATSDADSTSSTRRGSVVLPPGVRALDTESRGSPQHLADALHHDASQNKASTAPRQSEVHAGGTTSEAAGSGMADLDTLVLAYRSSTGAYVAVKGPSNGLAIKPKLRPWRPQGVDGVVEETASSTFSSRARQARVSFQRNSRHSGHLGHQILKDTAPTRIVSSRSMHASTGQPQLQPLPDRQRRSHSSLSYHSEPDRGQRQAQRSPRHMHRSMHVTPSPPKVREQPSPVPFNIRMNVYDHDGRLVPRRSPHHLPTKAHSIHTFNAPNLPFPHGSALHNKVHSASHHAPEGSSLHTMQHSHGPVDSCVDMVRSSTVATRLFRDDVHGVPNEDREHTARFQMHAIESSPSPDRAQCPARTISLMRISEQLAAAAQSVRREASSEEFHVEVALSPDPSLTSLPHVE